MKLFQKKYLVVASLASLILALPAQGSVNKDVRVGDGETAGGAHTVNGSVKIGQNATLTGDIGTVNGSVRVGDGSQIEDAGTVNGSVRLGDNVRSEDLESVNGGITIGAGSTVDGNVETVNGGVKLGNGGEISGSVENINGDIRFDGATVGGNVSTVNGDVELLEQSVVKGDIIVEKPRGSSWGNNKKPKIVIGPGSRVEGSIKLEREVRLYISETAEVGDVEGEMSMADAIRFSGKKP